MAFVYAISSAAPRCTLSSLTINVHHYNITRHVSTMR